MTTDIIEDLFKLDARLAGDAVFVKDLTLSRILLMNDSRFPWVILVPRITGLNEVTDLNETQALCLFKEIQSVSAALKKLYFPERVNIGALGNIVSQAHIHVIARHSSDSAWPKPVWGVGVPEPYRKETLRKTLSDLADLL